MNYKHYIKINGNSMIIDNFSSAFRQPVGGEILVKDTNERHFNLGLYDNQGILQYQWQDPDIVKIDIPIQPEDCCEWDGSEWIPNIEKMKEMYIAYIRTNARKILTLSDCLVSRYRDEIEEGVTPTITSEEYTAELTHRRGLRTYIDERLSTVANATQMNDVMDIKNDIDGKMADEVERCGY